VLNQVASLQNTQAPKQQVKQIQAKQKEVKCVLEEGMMIDPRYKGLICYNCGEPGHFVGICRKPKICFICAILVHYMIECPQWKKSQTVAAYMGSAESELGFYHIDIPEGETTNWLNINNCGVVLVKKGNISMVELEKELFEIFCKEWPWQIRELTSSKFLVRFPPHRKVSDIKNLLSFNLRKEGVQVEVVEWIRELEHFSELAVVWIHLDGIPPKWCDWRVFSQIASNFGLLLEVDWSSLFKSFYDNVRIKIACRNPRKIPQERLLEMNKKLYLINIMVEGFEAEKNFKPGEEDGDDPYGGEDDINDDETSDLYGNPEDMDTDKKTSDSSSSKTPKVQKTTNIGAKIVSIAQSDPNTIEDVEIDGGNSQLEFENIQSVENIAHLYEGEGVDEEFDMEHCLRWEEFLKNKTPQQEEDNERLLKAMDLIEEKTQKTDGNEEE
jgi:hypothetical protein